MDLSQYAEENREELTLWAEFKGFEVELAYVDRVDLNAALEQCKRRRWKKHQPVDEFDEEKLSRYLARLVRGWRNLTLGLLAGLMPIRVAEADRDKALPCTESNKLEMLRRVYDFDQFVIDTVTEVQRFREARLDGEIPNSDASPGSS